VATEVVVSIAVVAVGSVVDVSAAASVVEVLVVDELVVLESDVGTAVESVAESPPEQAARTATAARIADARRRRRSRRPIIGPLRVPHTTPNVRARCRER
jgi:hypothetical protein